MFEGSCNLSNRTIQKCPLLDFDRNLNPKISQNYVFTACGLRKKTHLAAPHFWVSYCHGLRLVIVTLVWQSQRSQLVGAQPWFCFTIIEALASRIISVCGRDTKNGCFTESLQVCSVYSSSQQLYPSLCLLSAVPSRASATLPACWRSLVMWLDTFPRYRLTIPLCSLPQCEWVIPLPSPPVRWVRLPHWKHRPTSAYINPSANLP